MSENLSMSNEQGILWYKSGDYKKAKKCWEVSADQGNASSMFCLGVLYLSARYYDLNMAKMWFKKADLAGHKNAGYQLECLRNGKIKTSVADNIFCHTQSNILNISFEIITFGNYDWLALKKTDKKMLLLSKEIIDIRKYHNVPSPATWETCDIRNWLNSDFYNSFTVAEKELICDTLVTNDRNPQYFTDGGQDTTDKCFLLSCEEVKEYFPSENDIGKTEDLLSSKDDNYLLMATVNMSEEKINEAKKRTGLDYSMANGQTLGWWLRTPGADNQRTVRINCNGAIRLHGRENNRNLVGIRPAMWVKYYE